MTLWALGRTHLPSAPPGAPGGYVLIRQSDSPGVPVLASPEPTLLPKLRVYFAEFPYPRCPAPEAARLGDLLRFRYGRPASARLFSRARGRSRAPLRCSTRPSARARRCPSPRRAPRASRRARRRRARGGGKHFPFAAQHARLRPGSLLAETLLLVGPWRQARYSLQDLRARTLHAPSPPRFFACAPPGYSHTLKTRQGVGGTCSALLFQRARVRQESCDTLLGGCRPPWPPACCPDPRPAFAAVRVPAAPYPCARFTPPRACCLPARAHTARRCARVRSSRPPSSALPRATRARRLSCGTFRREPATRRFDWSFAATPSSRDRFARQAPSEPLPGLPPPSLAPGVVHRLSGRCARALRVSCLLACLLRARRAPSSRRSARPRAALLGPCFKTGRALARAARASRRLFRAFSLRSRASFLLSLAVLLLYRPIRVFSL